MTLNQYIRYSAYLASMLAVVFLIMGTYGDYVIYSMFHDFIRFNLPNWPYYLCSIGIVALTYCKRYLYLCLIVFLIPDVVNYQVKYLAYLLMHPNAMTLHYTVVLAISICLMVLFALAAGILSIINLKSK
jgi:hypothetical protein